MSALLLHFRLLNSYTINKGIYEWISTYISNERNATWKSQRIQNDLDLADLTTALTEDWNDKGQYWVCIGNRVWVYNYRVDVWYILDLAHTPTCFVIIEKDLHFGTADGKIMKYSPLYSDYDGTLINATWEMGFFNFGVDWLRKFIQRLFISILPAAKTHVDVSYETDLNNTSDVFTAEYGLSSFATWDFSDFSFSTNYSPQPKKFKIRAKKIDYFKLKLANNGLDSVTVLSITLPTRTGGEVKGA